MKRQIIVAIISGLIVVGGVVAFVLVNRAEAPAEPTVETTETEPQLSSLQQSQINTQLRTDINRIAAQLTNYAADNNGRYPSDSDAIDQFEQSYLPTDLVHPVSDRPYTVNQLNSDGHQVTYVIGQCDDDQIIQTDQPRQRALQIELVGGDFFCTDI